MLLTRQQVAAAFSSGNFHLAYPHLADEAKWNIMGDKTLEGKESIIAFCTQTAHYFASVSTTFTISNIVTGATAVAIDGTAVFINPAGEKTCIASCDVYCFDNEKLVQINSYCITINQNS